jgi:hypothetical protein
VPDDDLVIADEDFLDEKPQDTLTFRHSEGHPPTSVVERGT